MEANKSKKENAGSSPELAAIAFKAIEQALARHQISQAQLERLANEPQPIFDFFDELLAKEESNPMPTFRLHLEQQSFVIEALTGECLKVDHAKLLAPSYRRNFVVEAAACFSGDSPATSETMAHAYRFKGSAGILEAFAVIAEDVESLVFTKAQIRHFCAKNADIILLRKMIPVFLFDRCELIHDCQKGLMTATAQFDNYNLHINIGSTNGILSQDEGKNVYLIAPNKQGGEHDNIMLEVMEAWTGVG